MQFNFIFLCVKKKKRHGKERYLKDNILDCIVSESAIF